MPLNIAHLSDIHFLCDPKQIGHDPNRHMRDELLDDLEAQSERLGGLHALIISGDIAYGGRKREFELASKWVKEICERTGCPVESIFVCPGNHDVDRMVLTQKSFIEDSHAAIRSVKNNELRDSELKRRLGLPDTKAFLYESLENYNHFALAYNCCFHADGDNYAWSRDLSLDDGSVLRIRGLNTALLSGQKDLEKSLFLGRSAWSIGREPGVEYLAFSHHPPKWLVDGDDMMQEFANKVRLQLYGHEHDQRIVRTHDSVTLFAGAVNPHRSESHWQPGYNIIEVGVSTRESKRYMQVRIHAREWQSKNPQMFKPYAGTGTDFAHEIEFALRPWTAKPKLESAPVPSVNLSVTPSNHIPPHEQQYRAPTTPPPVTLERVLYPFMELERNTQRDIIKALGLNLDEDDELPDFLQIKNALVRAKEDGLLSKLFDMIAAENAHGY